VISVLYSNFTKKNHSHTNIRIICTHTKIDICSSILLQITQKLSVGVILNPMRLL